MKHKKNAFCCAFIRMPAFMCMRTCVYVVFQGNVAFSSQGDRIASTQIEQMRSEQNFVSGYFRFSISTVKSDMIDWEASCHIGTVESAMVVCKTTHHICTVNSDQDHVWGFMPHRYEASCQSYCIICIDHIWGFMPHRYKALCHIILYNLWWPHIRLLAT